MSDLMFYGVLRMPYEMAMENELSRRQFYDRAQEAANRVERLDAARPVADAGEAYGFAIEYDVGAVALFKGNPQGVEPVIQGVIVPLYRAAPSARTLPPQEFIDYVKANYSGVVDFYDAEWHAKRLWNAAMRATSTASAPAAPTLPDGDALYAAWRKVGADVAGLRWENFIADLAATSAQGEAIIPALTAYAATDLDGRVDVALTIEEAKRRAGPGCDTIIPLYEAKAGDGVVRDAARLGGMRDALKIVQRSAFANPHNQIESAFNQGVSSAYNCLLAAITAAGTADGGSEE